MYNGCAVNPPIKAHNRNNHYTKDMFLGPKCSLFYRANTFFIYIEMTIATSLQLRDRVAGPTMCLLFRGSTVNLT